MHFLNPRLVEMHLRQRYRNTFMRRSMKTKYKSFKYKLLRSIAKRLVVDSMLPLKQSGDHVLHNTSENSLVYTVFLQGLPRLSRVANAKLFRLKVFGAPFAFNPSLVRTERGWLSIVRDTNIVVVNDGEKYCYTSVPHRTENYALNLDDNFDVKEVQKLNLAAFDFAEAKNGVEDIRLIDVKGKIYGIGAGISIIQHPHNRKITQILFSITTGGQIENAHVIESPFGSLVEKNWMPFVHNSMLHFLYSPNPLIIFKFDRGALTPVTQTGLQGPVDHAQFRYSGSTNGIPFRGGYLFIVHTRKTYEEKISYVHYFMFLNDRLELLQISEPFLFERPGIEFAVNMIPAGEDIVISYGLGDRRSRLVQISADQVADMVSLG